MSTTVSAKMTAIADEIRTLSDTASPLGLDAMAERVGEANEEVASQEDLIADIIAALEGKTANECRAEFKKVKLPPVEQYGAVGYANGKYIAHATNGTGAYSEDGVNWTKVTIPSTGSAKDIAYGNGVYVAAHFGGMRYSADGIVWTECTLPVPNSNWASVCYGNGKFFAGSWGGYFISSEDGITWTQVGSQYGYFVGNPCHVDYGNGTFVVTMSSMGEFVLAAYSTDGVTWTYGSSIAGLGGGYATCYGGGKFVTLGLPEGYSGEQKPGAYSEDGINWIGFDLPFNPGQWTSVTYGNGVYIGVGKGGLDDDMGSNQTPIKKAIYSTDGINWQEIELPSAQVWVSVCHGDNGFVAISEQGAVAHSVDGLNWTEAELPVTTIPAYAVAYGGGKFVAVSPMYIAYSTDGLSWRMTATPTDDMFATISYGNGIFLAIGIRNAIYSKNGINWTLVEMGTTWASQMALGFCNGKFYAGFKNPATDLPHSTDGINWEYAQGVLEYVTAICYGKGKYVEVGRGTYNGTLAIAGYSTDGITWTETPMPSDQAWIAACYGKGKFVAVAENSQYGAYSKDGINWTQMQLPSARQWAAITYGNGMFIATAINSDVAAYSMDGITWEETSMPTITSGWASIFYGGGKFVATHGTTGGVCSVCDVTKPLK